MKTSQLTFKIPKHLLPNKPLKERDEAKLMVVYRKNQKIKHEKFKNLFLFFKKDDVLILNNTKVFPSKLFGTKEKTDAKIEIFLLREIDSNNKIWDILVYPARKVRVGNKIFFFINKKTIILEIIDNTTSRGRIGRFISKMNSKELKNEIKKIGKIPIPTYLSYNEKRYQTVYAKKEGAIYSPTAGLNFSKFLLKKLKIKEVKITELTLHIGLTSLLPVEVEDLSKHKMDSEKCFISNKTCQIINKSIEKNKKICTVGISSMRAIESSVSSKKTLNPFNGWTNKFIYYPYNFKIANSMITNFHFPKSTLLMMVVAFAGYDLTMKSYQLAIENNYRFGAYGDSMLII